MDDLSTTSSDTVTSEFEDDVDRSFSLDADDVRACYEAMRDKADFQVEPLGSIILDRSPQWLIEGLMPATGIHVLYGAPGTGKSFLALHAALHVAAGLPWANRQVRESEVVYVASEGGRNFRKRVVAIKQALGVPDHVRFGLITTAPRLGGSSSKSDVKRLIERIKSQGWRPGLIVLDTLSRSVDELNESSSQDVMTFVRDAEQLVSTFGCLVMPVHHCGKDESKGMRGSSALHGSADAEWMVSRRQDTGTRLLTVEKMKDGPDRGRLRYDLEDVKLGVDETECDIVTCFAKVFTDAPAEHAHEDRAGKVTQEYTIGVLVKLLAVIEGQGSAGPNLKLIPLSRVFEAATSANLFPGKDRNYIKLIIKRSLATLHEKGSITCDDDQIKVACEPS